MIFKNKTLPFIRAFAVIFEKEYSASAEQVERIIEYVSGDSGTLPDLTIRRLFLYEFESTLRALLRQGLTSEYNRALYVLYHVSKHDNQKIEVILLHMRSYMIVDVRVGKENTWGKLSSRAEKLQTICDIFGADAIRIYIQHFIHAVNHQLDEAARRHTFGNLTEKITALLTELTVLSRMNAAELPAYEGRVHPLIYHLVAGHHEQVEKEVAALAELLCTAALPDDCRTYRQLEENFVHEQTVSVREARYPHARHAASETLTARQFFGHVSLLAASLLYKINLHGSKHDFLASADSTDRKLLECLTVLYNIAPLDVIEALVIDQAADWLDKEQMETEISGILPETEPYPLLLFLTAAFDQHTIPWEEIEQTTTRNIRDIERAFTLTKNPVVKMYLYQTLQRAGYNLSRYGMEAADFVTPYFFEKTGRASVFYHYITGQLSLDTALEKKVLDSNHIDDIILLLSFLDASHVYARRLFVLLSHYPNDNYKSMRTFVHFYDCFRDKAMELLEMYQHDPDMNTGQFLFSTLDLYTSYYNKLPDEFYANLIIQHQKLILAIYETLSADVRAIVLTVLLTQKGAENPDDVLLRGLHDGSKKAYAIAANELFNRKDATFYIQLYQSEKKAKVKELALTALRGVEGHAKLYEQLLAAEKNKKYKALIEQHLQYEEGSPVDLHTGLDRLIDKRKLSRLKWLAIEQLPALVDLSGKPFTDDMKAYILTHSLEATAAPDPNVLAVRDQLTLQSRSNFAGDVLAAWLANGSPAKERWVLLLCTALGDIRIVDMLTTQIKEWAEHARGAIAADAVRALAFLSDLAALRTIDTLKRTVKNRQVKNAAAEALALAAQHLQITAEELEDRLVPDLGFDRTGRRTFTYGQRTFTAKVNNELELILTNDETGKAIKSLPKPGAQDDEQLAEAARDELKRLKKELKNLVQNQSIRLESALSQNRLWSASSWKSLFIDNMLMQKFAISIIWGIYEDGTLQATFRYADDGTFTTADEDEYEIEETAQIGLVHPLELSEEEIEAWRMQLEDYEITQPFAQLSRELFYPTEDEIESRVIIRFTEDEYSPSSFANSLEKSGWYKGIPQDAGVYSEFYKEYGAIIAELTFNGTSITYYEGIPDIRLEQLALFANAEDRYHYYQANERLALSDVSPRIFSETLYDIAKAAKKLSQADR